MSTVPAAPPIKYVLGRDGFEDTMFEAKAKARQRRGQGQGQTTSRPRPRPNYLEAASRPKPNLFYLKKLLVQNSALYES